MRVMGIALFLRAVFLKRGTVSPEELLFYIEVLLGFFKPYPAEILREIFFFMKGRSFVNDNFTKKISQMSVGELWRFLDGLLADRREDNLEVRLVEAELKMRLGGGKNK